MNWGKDINHGIIMAGNGGIQLTEGCSSLGVSTCSASCLGAVRVEGELLTVS